MKKFMRKALASMLVFTMCFSSVNISAFAQNVDEIDTTTEVVIEQTTDDTIEETTSVDESISESETDAEPTTTSDNSGWDRTTKEKIFEGENFKVYFTLSSNWDAGYNATIKLENTGDESIQNWYLGFEYADSITNIWNAEISSNENGYYTIKNVGWNQNIAVGQSIEFGITSNEGFSGFPLKYELLGQISNVNIGDYNINYILTNDWETGFSSTITINNDSDTDFENWGANTLFSEFEDMSTSLFSTGKMENVIKNMILHFKEGSGSDYSNATLTQEAYKHKSTQKYINDIKGEVIRRLKNNGGNIYDLEFTEEGNKSGKSIYNWAQQNVSYPRFHENSDIIHGLTICVNDTWGNTVEVKDYNFDGEHFSGTLHFCIYDHFGLDQPDVEKTYVNLAGFRAWYVLQHYDYFNGSFVPFVTLMEFDVPFESDIIMFKPVK